MSLRTTVARLRPDGTALVLHVTGEIVAGETGRPVRLGGAAQDVTEAREAERKASQAARELAMPSARLDAVVAVLAGQPLQAIDLAASHYAGSVGVILANDGSSDRTHELATRTIAGFAHASGDGIDVRHGGKSATLNAALAQTTTDLVVRIDADTLIGEWSLHFVPRWFDDPEIGLVEAMMFPRWRPSPFPRMRLFEELKQFGINHRAMEVVDGVNVVPGVFTAFRREPALSVGGFTVGMNGEDGDFTFKFSRLGYRSHLDPKVVVYEDVPPTYSEMREQRVRWDRATLHHGARNGPLRAGLATPKVWFSHFHQFFSRVYGPVSLTLGAYLCVLAVFQGTYRVPVVVYFAARLVISMGTMAIDIFAAAHYHHTRRIGWLLAWPIWQVMLMLFSAEAWLSLPVRPPACEPCSRPPLPRPWCIEPAASNHRRSPPRCPRSAPRPCVADRPIRHGPRPKPRIACFISRPPPEGTLIWHPGSTIK